jgi:hypothetical protein
MRNLVRILAAGQGREGPGGSAPAGLCRPVPHASADSAASSVRQAARLDRVPLTSGAELVEGSPDRAAGGCKGLLPRAADVIGRSTSLSQKPRWPPAAFGSSPVPGSPREPNAPGSSSSSFHPALQRGRRGSPGPHPWNRHPSQLEELLPIHLRMSSHRLPRSRSRREAGHCGISRGGSRGGRRTTAVPLLPLLPLRETFPFRGLGFDAKAGRPRGRSGGAAAAVTATGEGRVTMLTRRLWQVTILNTQPLPSRSTSAASLQAQYRTTRRTSRRLRFGTSRRICRSC